MNSLPDKTIIVGKIYSNGCIHCQMMQPEWSKFTELLRTKSVNVQLKEIEASQNEKEQIDELNNTVITGESKLTSNGYPTIFKIDNGVLEYFEGERTAENMMNWVFPTTTTTTQTAGKKERRSNKRHTKKKNVLGGRKTKYQMRKRRTVHHNKKHGKTAKRNLRAGFCG